VNILYQDDQVLVVDKPPGLSVLPDGWEVNNSFLVKELEKEFKKVWVVHRLDKVTSGVIIFALTADAHRNLSQQFEQHQIEKIYHAIVIGDPEWNEKITKFPLRADVGHSHRTVVDSRNGKPSETCFKVMERFKDFALLEAKPKTGRTHQVRVHAYALNHPLLGDVLYSAPKTGLITRPALHSFSLTLVHPTKNEQMILSSPYPSDFSEALKIISS